MKDFNYILDDNNNVVPVPADDIVIWARWFENYERRRVADTRTAGVRVSTVFLGLDHRWGGDGPPLVFETMIFGGPYDQYQDRHSSWDDAVLGHRRACLVAFTPYMSRNLREGRYLHRLAKRKPRLPARRKQTANMGDE
jgi:hypothetical protein